MRTIKFRVYRSIPFLVIIFIFFLTKCYAQFHHGLEIGIHTNNADFKFNESKNPTNQIGFLIGYSAERDLSDNLYLRLGVGFNKREIKAINIRGINTTKEKWRADVFEIPINMGYYLNWNNRNFQFFVDAGINLGYNSRVSVQNDKETIRLDIGKDGAIKRFTTGANASIGLLIKHRCKVRLNYYYALTNMITTEGNVWKNRTFSLSLNYFLKDRPLVY